MTDQTGIDPRAIDSLSVAPDKDPADRSASEQGPVKEHEDRLDEALDETMDASDPVSATQPGQGEPAPSSGFDKDAEDELQVAKS